VVHEDHDGGVLEEENLSQKLTHHENAQGEGGRRRRRRGRRGGRRNRQRNEERPSFGDAAPQAEPQHAPEDVDHSPAYESEPVYTPPTDYHPAPPPESSAIASGEPDVPRRRSTIREPASFSSGSPAPSNNPTSTPVVSSSGDEPAAPKRGWWGKRLLGDKE
jgi:ribonuclease E